MPSITWASPTYVQELTTILGPQNRTQGSCDLHILYSLHTQVRLDKGTRDTVHEKIEQFRFSALWMSGVASGLSLCIAQYSAFKIQHEHDTTVGQK